MTKPSDRTTTAVPTANSRPAGGEQRPSNVIRAPEKPAPTSADFGGFGRKEGE
jgi:hypothetical protein